MLILKILSVLSLTVTVQYNYKRILSFSVIKLHIEGLKVLLESYKRSRLFGSISIVYRVRLMMILMVMIAVLCTNTVLTHRHSSSFRSVSSIRRDILRLTPQAKPQYTWTYKQNFDVLSEGPFAVWVGLFSSLYTYADIVIDHLSPSSHWQSSMKIQTHAPIVSFRPNKSINEMFTTKTKQLYNITPCKANRWET
jgi:hypothetical protein